MPEDALIELIDDIEASERIIRWEMDKALDKEDDVAVKQFALAAKALCDACAALEGIYETDYIHE